MSSWSFLLLRRFLGVFIIAASIGLAFPRQAYAQDAESDASKRFARFQLEHIVKGEQAYRVGFDYNGAILLEMILPEAMKLAEEIDYSQIVGNFTLRRHLLNSDISIVAGNSGPDCHLFYMTFRVNLLVFEAYVLTQHPGIHLDRPVVLNLMVPSCDSESVGCGEIRIPVGVSAHEKTMTPSFLYFNESTKVLRLTLGEF